MCTASRQPSACRSLGRPAKTGTFPAHDRPVSVRGPAAGYGGTPSLGGYLDDQAGLSQALEAIDALAEDPGRPALCRGAGGGPAVAVDKARVQPHMLSLGTTPAVRQSELRGGSGMHG